jgi:hypothetical protein
MPEDLERAISSESTHPRAWFYLAGSVARQGFEDALLRLRRGRRSVAPKTSGQPEVDCGPSEATSLLPGDVAEIAYTEPNGHTGKFKVELERRRPR